MNERIRELAEQAGFGIAGNPEYIHAMDYDGMCTDELEKFAELIVRECAEYIDAFNREHMVEEGIGGTELKQHFEVE